MSIEIQPITTPLRPRGDDPSTWVYLADLPLPAEDIKKAEVFARKYRMGRVGLQGLLECARYRRYFYGLCIATTLTPRGTLVLMADETVTPEFDHFLRNLPPELEGKVLLDCTQPIDPELVEYHKQSTGDDL